MIITNVIHCLSYCSIEIIISIVILPQVRMRYMYTYVCVSVCLSRLLQLLRDNEVQISVSIGKISICGFANNASLDGHAQSILLWTWNFF